jgi:molybdopterin synthase catalytic subunit
MQTSLLITSEGIVAPPCSADGGESGAVLHFWGHVRGVENGQAIAGLEYEAFQKMAERQFALIFEEIETRWPVQSVKLIHRIGFVKAGGPSLWVEVVAPHRGEAFAACQYLIDEMKKRVPIWKKVVPSGN